MSEQTKVVIVSNITKPNKHGWCFSLEAMEKMVEQFRGQEVLGEIGEDPEQPRSPLPRFLTETASHAVKNMRIEGGVVVGEIHVLDTPNGKALQEIMSVCGSEFRPRGLCGNIKNGVIGDFTLLSIDAVAEGA